MGVFFPLRVSIFRPIVYSCKNTGPAEPEKNPLCFLLCRDIVRLVYLLVPLLLRPSVFPGGDRTGLDADDDDACWIDG